MRRALLIAATVTILSLGSLSSDAQAAGRCPSCGQYHTRSYHAPKQNVFQKMWELEQRKNAWLRRTFLNG